MLPDDWAVLFGCRYTADGLELLPKGCFDPEQSLFRDSAEKFFTKYFDGGNGSEGLDYPPLPLLELGSMLEEISDGPYEDRFGDLPVLYRQGYS